MSYEVLARKWRPRTFSTLVGQEHVVRALTNALDQDRVHHAFLFTGTRGVGKTTVARIFAKALNCEEGVRSEPCGVCSACTAIDEGRFLDLIEVDAASRTKVEDTRDLLENVQYAPTQARYKIYLIDEVHMLSPHSFNALLKTLEEPPPHVKFLLATTDPQKLPVTVLSRCLQFNLKRLPAKLIGGYLEDVLGKESVESDPVAVKAIARAADGSMRDALSLLDQAIAYGSGTLKGEEVARMLGTIDSEHVIHFLQALAAGDGANLLKSVDVLSEQAPDYNAVLADLITQLQHLAVVQLVPEAVPEDWDDREALEELAGHFSPEQTQLIYQIALNGRKDLPLSPDPRSGFEMVLLRMLAFKPVGSTAPTNSGGGGGGSKAQRSGADAARQALNEARDAATDAATGAATGASAGSSAIRAPAAMPKPEAPKRPPAPAESVRAISAPVSQEPVEPAPMAKPAVAPEVAKPESELAAEPIAKEANNQDQDWHDIVQKLNLTGMVRELANNANLLGREGGAITLSITPLHANLINPGTEKRLTESLAEYFGEAVRIQFQQGKVQGETVAQRKNREQTERLDNARRSFANDPNVRAMVETFGATIVPESIQPRD